MLKTLSALVAAAAVTAGALAVPTSAEAGGWKDRIKAYTAGLEIDTKKRRVKRSSKSCSGKLSRYVKSGCGKSVSLKGKKLKSGKLRSAKSLAAGKLGGKKLLKSKKLKGGTSLAKYSGGKKLNTRKLKSAGLGGKALKAAGVKGVKGKAKSVRTANFAAPKLKKNSGSVKTMLKDIVGSKIDKSSSKKGGCKRYIPAAGLTINVPCGL